MPAVSCERGALSLDADVADPYVIVVLRDGQTKAARRCSVNALKEMFDDLASGSSPRSASHSKSASPNFRDINNGNQLELFDL